MPLNKKKPFWGYLEKDLCSTRDWKKYDTLSFWSYVPASARDLIDLSVMIYEADGSAYISQSARSLKKSGWEEANLPFEKFFLAGSWTRDENGKLDLDQIRKISVGIFQPKDFSDKQFIIYVNDIRAVASHSQRATALVKRIDPVVRTNELGKFEPQDGNVYHGVWVFPDFKEMQKEGDVDWKKQIDVKEIAEYERLSGRSANLVSFAWPFANAFPTEMCKKIDGLGKVPHIGVMTSAEKPSEIIRGKFDKKIADWAAAAKRYGKPVFFRFYAEMNGNWNSYSEAFDPSQTHRMYIKAWRRVVNGFRKAGAENIIWVWSPTAVDVGNIHWTDYYPGDDYVDWVGMSVYSFIGNGDPESQILGIYNDYAARKPIMISESAGGDADNNPKTYRTGNSYFDNPEKWINRYFDTLENKAPRVKAFVWFNIDSERVWKIQESPEKIAVFRKRLSNQRYGLKFIP